MSRSATPERGDLHSLFNDDELDLDNFDLEGFTQEEAVSYNEIAEHGQRLQDALIPKKVAASIRKAPSELPPKIIKWLEHTANPVAGPGRNGHTQPSITKQMNHYIRKHPFFQKSLAVVTKSERRQFERNVYDFARGLGLKKSEARRHVVKAREFCGEEQSDSDSTSFEGEIDDSRWILESCSSLNESAAEVMVTNLRNRRVDCSDKTRAAPEVPTNAGEATASMSAGTKPSSKKRKAKAASMDDDSDLLRKALELAAKNDAQQAAHRIAEGEVAGRDLKRKRKRQKRLESTRDVKIEPAGDMENLSKSAKSPEPGAEGGRKSEDIKNYRYPSLKRLMKLNALEQELYSGNREASHDEPIPAQFVTQVMGFSSPMIQSA